MNNDVIEIEFRANYQADIAKGLLNANGIDCEMMPIAVEGDRCAYIMIRKEDEKLAREILQTDANLEEEKE